MLSVVVISSARPQTPPTAVATLAERVKTRTDLAAVERDVAEAVEKMKAGAPPGEWRAAWSDAGKEWQDQAKQENSLSLAVAAIALHRALEDRAAVGHATLDAGIVCYQLEKFDCAEKYAASGLAIGRKLDDALIKGRGLVNTGLLLQRKGDADRAVAHYEQSIALFQALRDHRREGIGYTNLASLREEQKRTDEAVAAYGKSLAAFRRAQDLAGASAALTALGGLEHNRQAYDAALRHYTDALSIQRELRDRKGEALALSNVGYVQFKLKQFSQALLRYQDAAVIHRELGDRRGEALALQNMAATQSNLRQYAQSLEHYGDALRLQRELGDRRAEGDTLFSMGSSHYRLQQYSRALEHYQGALRIRRELGDRRGEGRALQEIGASYNGLSRYGEALKNYEQALAIAREARDRPSELLALDAIGIAHSNLGQHNQGLRHAEQALALARELGDRRMEGNALHSLANAYNYLGQYAQALDHHRRALAIARETDDRFSESRVLMNMGLVYTNLGQYTHALQHLEQALPITREVGDRYGETILVSNLGNVYYDLKQRDKALEYYQQSLSMARELGHRDNEANALGNIGHVHDSQRRYAQALDYYRQALAIKRETGDRHHETVALTNIGLVHVSLGQYPQAMEQLQLALPIAEEVGALEGQWRMNGALQLNLTRMNRRDEAIFYGKRAVNAIQSLRAAASALDISLQGSLLDNKRIIYQDLANLLIDAGRFSEAQQVLAMLKEEEYFDFVRRDARADARITSASYVGVEQDLAARYTQISQRLVTLGREYSAIARIPDDARTSDQKARYVSVQRDLDVARTRYRAFLGEIETTFQQSGRKEISASTLREIEGLQSTLEDLGEGTVLVHFLVTPDRLRILLTTPDIQIHRDAQVGEAELNRLVFAYRQTLQDPRLDPRPRAQALYKHLIAPIAADLEQAGAKVVMVSLDGVLRYLPIAALHDGEQWLIERYGLSVYTAAARNLIGVAPKSEWRIAALGVSQGAEGFSPLPAVPYELDGIVRETRADDTTGVLPGQVSLDGKFTDQALRTALEQRYPVVHIASHFRFTPGTNTDSYLLLGNNGRLSLADLSGQHFRFGNVDLLTLSACETAIGDKGGSGTEVEGLGVTVQQRGARSVLATLWSVADASTGVFMQTLYELRQQKGLSKAEALRQAQLAFLRGERGDREIPVSLRRGVQRDEPRAGKPSATPYVADPTRPFAHPFYWAPFILMGNWL